MLLRLTLLLSATISNVNAVGATGVGHDVDIALGATNAVGIGNNADITAAGVNAILISSGGNTSTANAANAIAVGNNADATTAGAIAIGQNAQATGTGGVALGSGASNAGFANTVALGAGSTNTAANQVAVGGQTAATARVVTGVAPGVISATSFDAINGSQLNATNGRLTAAEADIDTLFAQDIVLGQRIHRTDRRAAGGTAVAIAMGGNAFLPDKTFNLTGNVGVYRSAVAGAINLVR